MIANKKTITVLRDELIQAATLSHFRVLHLNVDNAIISLSYSVKNHETTTNRLKTHIQKNYEKILVVDVFQDYMVVWHDHVPVEKKHQINMGGL